jgi:hypothetical protein
MTRIEREPRVLSLPGTLRKASRNIGFLEIVSALALKVATLICLRRSSVLSGARPIETNQLILHRNLYLLRQQAHARSAPVRSRLAGAFYWEQMDDGGDQEAI